jgi:ABC-2 type transport system permease protein
MDALLGQIAISLRLHARNRMALVYGYIFPTIFLVAFWVLYRFEEVPLIRHVGELLTVTALGGACFGLPTTMVSERERGVWRRYRLTPVSTATLVSGTVVARYVLLVAAGVLQVLLAMGLGMPLPRHPFELFLAFTCVAFAFIGLGLVIAMMADNVPAVQALGQCIFLPMLIIGGVAVPLATLPDWAQRLSAFFPGRYAVQALQACANGTGLTSAQFSVFALLLIGAAGCLAGSKLFRWDAQQRFATAPGKAWVGVALAAWVAVGIMADADRRPPRPTATSAETVTAPPAVVAPTSTVPAAPVPQPAQVLPPKEDRPPNPSAGSRAAESGRAPGEAAGRPAGEPGGRRAGEEASGRAGQAGGAVAGPEPPPARSTATPGTSPPASWRDVTMADIDRDLIFTRLPPDSGVVTPIAPFADEPDEETARQLDKVRYALPEWKPGKVSDPVQRVRNYLYVAAVPDVFQMQELERFIPHVVFERIQEDVPKDELIKILYWIAVHPFDGDDSAVDELRPLGLYNGPADMEQTRGRLSVYAVKLLGRITGRITPE